MSATAVKRMKFTQVDAAMADDRVRLARRAQEVLGYKKLAQALVIPDALMFGLRKLGIEPLVQGGVEDYKRKKAKPGMWSGHKEAIVVFSSIFLFCRFWIPWLASKVHNWSDPGLAAVGAVLSLILAVIFTIFALVLLFDRDFRGERITRSWERVPLSQHTGSIPEFVLDKAVRIKTEIPVVELYIDELHERQERIMLVSRDPFLVATLGDETYYIDVWDEREYEATL